MSSSSDHKILIITYYWPPAGGPGVQRWLKLSKYLARLGADITILTVDPEVATYPLKDESLFADVADGIEVIRTGTSEKFNLYKKVTRKKEVPFSGFANEKKAPGLKDKLARFVRGNFFVPDARVGWNKKAIQVASKVIEEKGITTVITTSPPHSSQLIGKALRDSYKVKWIADFRDPWTDIYYYDLFYPTAFTRKRELKMEREVLERADVILTASDGFKDLFVAKSEAIDPNKIWVMTNGFDPEDFNHIDAAKNDVFTITYAGTITQQYPIHGFVNALGKLDFNVVVRMIGRWDGTIENTLNQAAENVRVDWVSYIPKKELNVELMKSDVLLLVNPDIEKGAGIIPGKLFDYMGCGKPILALGNRGDNVGDRLQESGAGVFCTYEDSDRITEFLRGVHTGEIQVDSTKVVQYDRQSQASWLMEKL